MIKIVIFIFGAKIVTIMSFCKFQFVARKLSSFFTKDPVGKGPLKKARARALLLALPAATPAGVGAQAQAVLSGLKPRQPRHRWRPWLLCCAVLRERAWAAWLRGLRGSSCFTCLPKPNISRQHVPLRPTSFVPFYVKFSQLSVLLSAFYGVHIHIVYYKGVILEITILQA